MERPELKEKVESLPRTSGVYLMKNQEGKVLYVGKAKDLRARVRSYFRASGDSRLQVRFLVPNVADIDVIVTDTEKEALILENNLIKQHHPRYNVNFRDDKDYVSLRVDLRNPYPRFNIVRRPKNDGALYFGPYSSSQALRETLRLIYRVFPIRSCSDTVFRTRTRPCLYYQIHRCAGPCGPEGTRITPEAYRQLIDQVILFLQGRNDELMQLLKRRIEEESERFNYEEAGRIYRSLQAIEKTIERQKVISYRFKDVDAFGYYREEELVNIQRLLLREGKMLEGKTDRFDRQFLPDVEILSSYLNQYYAGNVIPEEILIPFPLEGVETLEEVLSERKGKRVEIACPLRGEKRQLVLMSCKNAQIAHQQSQRSHVASREPSEGTDDFPPSARSAEAVLSELQRKLNLSTRPTTIECFDISNLGGQQAVGSLVRFREGQPEKKGYRHYRIKTVEGDPAKGGAPNDYAMMAEVLERRYLRAQQEGDLPDLIMVDGGKGQLNIARDILSRLEIRGPGLISIAKSKLKEVQGRKKVRTEEKIYLVGRANPVIFPRNSPALHLLQQLRDEAHRFAITHHQRLRQREALSSPLDEIAGLGSKRKRLLLQHFGSLKSIEQASLQELETVPGLGSKLARQIYAFFRG